MNEKFKKEKYKQYLIYIVVIVMLGAIVTLFSMLFDDKKPSRNNIKFKIMDNGIQDEETFKTRYGERVHDVELTLNQINKKLNNLENENTRLKKNLNLFKETKSTGVKGITPPPRPLNNSPLTNSNNLVGSNDNLKNSNSFKKASQSGKPSQQPILLNDVIVYDAAPVKLDEKTPEKKIKKTASNTLTPGTFSKAIMLNGFDAACGGKAKSQPSPVLFRLIGYSQLPNFFKSAMGECFVTASATCNQSSERALIRTEKLSCVKNDGTIIVKNITGFINGPDGKEGVAGHIVEKRGLILARTAISGVIDGVAGALAQSSTITSVDSNGSMSTLDTDKLAQAAFAGGIKKPAQNLSDFYMDLINEMFATLEVNAGKEVDVVLLDEVDLREEIQ